jgi:hypothetical protein
MEKKVISRTPLDTRCPTLYNIVILNERTHSTAENNDTVRVEMLYRA